MRILFMGTPESAVPSLQRLLSDGHEVVSVWTQPDKPAGRGESLRQSPVKQFALEHSLPIEQPLKIKTDETKKLFASYEADLAVVVAYGRLLPNEFLEAPRKGCVNVHFSLLPKYRGAAPANWAMVNGEQKTGVTTMLVEEKLDAGPILLQQETTIGDAETAPELMRRLAVIGADLLSETLSQFDQITPQSQDEAAATFAPMLHRHDGAIDWSMPASAIERRVRGFQPWPNAHTSFRSQRLIVWQSSLTELTNANAAAGEIVVARAGELVVKCGEGTALHLIEVQPEGKRRMAARDFLNGSHLKVGDRLGEV